MCELPFPIFRLVDFPEFVLEIDYSPDTVWSILDPTVHFLILVLFFRLVHVVSDVLCPLYLTYLSQVASVIYLLVRLLL